MNLIRYRNQVGRTGDQPTRVGRSPLCGVIAILVSGALIVFVGCGGDDSGTDGELSASDEPIVIGQAKGFSGFMSSFDKPPATAAEMAVDDINAEGGLAGRKLKIVTADNHSTAEDGARAALDVIDQGASFVQASCDFDLGAPIAQAAQRQDVLTISDCAASVQFGVQGIGPLAFTLATPAITSGDIIAEWGAQNMGLTSHYLLFDPAFEYAKQVEIGFKQGVESAGSSIVGETTFSAEDPSIAGAVNDIKQSDADSIALITTDPGGAGAALRQLRAAGVNLPVLASDTLDGDFWKEAVPDVSDVYFPAYASIYGDDPSQFVNDLVKRYEADTGSTPDNATLVTGYGTIEAFTIAAEICDCLDGPGLAGALETFENEPLADDVLPTTFTTDLHVTLERPQRIMQIQDGRTSYLETYTLEEPPEITF